MKVEARQGGGIAGPALNQVAGPLDTAGVGEDGSRIEALVEEVGFFDLPNEFPEVRDMSDPMWHSLEVDDHERNRKVGWSDRAEPPEQLGEVFRLVVDAAGGWRNAD
jgi:hypothetical protein